MMDDLFRRLIIVAIESFPIDSSKNAAIIERILYGKDDEDG